MATARTHGVALATRDEKIIEYGKQGFLRVVEL
jgi:PIN domain nuclease of toxin-antitoxin system